MAEVNIDKDATPAAEPSTETPSAQLIREALTEAVVTDGRGRKIKLRKPGVLAQFRIMEVVGPERSSNQAYMQMVNPVIWDGAIDREEVLFPATFLQLEALIQRLDEDGIAAVMGWYFENVMQPIINLAQAEVEKARLKN